MRRPAHGVVAGPSVCTTLRLMILPPWPRACTDGSISFWVTVMPETRCCPDLDQRWVKIPATRGAQTEEGGQWGTAARGSIRLRLGLSEAVPPRANVPKRDFVG